MHRKINTRKKIAEEFHIPLLARDELKESLFDSLGIKDREWSKKLGVASFKLLYKLIEVLLKSNTNFIIETLTP